MSTIQILMLATILIYLIGMVAIRCSSGKGEPDYRRFLSWRQKIRPVCDGHECRSI